MKNLGTRLAMTAPVRMQSEQRVLRIATSNSTAEPVPPHDEQNLGKPIGDNLEGFSTLPSTNQLQGGGNVATNENSTTKPPRGCRVSALWPIESLALLASLACQIGLVLVFLRMANQPLEHWTLFVSLNTMVSILSNMSKSLILFQVASCISQLKWLYILSPQVLENFDLMDQASRGPSGSAKLLLRVPFRLVSLGAIVVVVATVMGPFSQQILRFEPRDVESPDLTATFGISHEYTRMPDMLMVNMPPAASLDYAMRGAFLKGLYGFDLTPEFNCSSTCIWHDTYTTLGFDSECHDVTSATLKTKTCIADHVYESVDHVDESVDDYDTNLSHTCTMTTPGNVSIITHLSPTSSQTVQYVSSNTHTDWSPQNWTVNQKPRAAEQFMSTEFLHVAQYQAEYRENIAGFYNSSVNECTLRIAAWQMSGVSANGSAFNVADRTRILLGSQGKMNYGNTQLKSIRRVSFNGTGIPPMAIDLWDWMAITSFILSQLSEIESMGGETQESTDPAKSSPLFAESTYGDISAVLERAARSMTDALRTGPGSDLQYGVLRQSVVFVKVDWLWYLLPGAVEVGTLALLIGTMWTSSRHRSRVPLWKDSSLGLLFHDVKQSSHSDNMLEMSTKIPDEEGLKAAAKSLVYLGKR